MPVVRREVYLVDLDARILADNTGTTTGRIEQYPIETAQNLREFSSIIRTNHDVFTSQPVDVGSQTLCPGLVRIVGEDHTSVLHESGHMGRFPSRGGSHIEYTLVGLWGEGNDGEKGGSCLEHVVASEVLGCGTCNGVRVQTRRPVAFDLPIGTVLSKT